MKVRIRQHQAGFYMVEVKKWYWPVWDLFEIRMDLPRAQEVAENLKRGVAYEALTQS